MLISKLVSDHQLHWFLRDPQLGLPGQALVSSSSLFSLWAWLSLLLGVLLSPVLSEHRKLWCFSVCSPLFIVLNSYTVVMCGFFLSLPRII